MASTMISLLTKENIALIGVIALFIWRIIDFLIRQKKKRETDREKLAFDMAKYQIENGREFPKASLFSYYLFYLDALEKDIKPYNHRRYTIMKSFETQLTEKVAHLEEVLQKLNDIEVKLSNNHEITPSDLWVRNLSWRIWWWETKKRIKVTFKRKIKFKSLK